MPRVNITLSDDEYSRLLEVKDWVYSITGVKLSDSKVAHDVLMYGVSIRLDEADL